MNRSTTPSPADRGFRAAIETLLTRKAEEVAVLDLTPVAAFTGAFVLCHGTSERQVRSLADEVISNVRDAAGLKPKIEGLETSEWILLDYGDFIVHLFSESARRFYRLETLWHDARPIDLEEAVGGVPG